MIIYDPQMGYIEVPDDATGSTPMPGMGGADIPGMPPGGGGITPSAPAAASGSAPYAGEGPGFHGFDYWQSQGVDPASMFDANGQILPGWQRTANGYERAAASGPSAAGLAPPTTGAGWMPQFVAPKFNAPAPFSFKDFTAPTLDEARNEPGFAFALEQGQKALENSAAGRGVLRTGGTLKDILGFGQKLGEQNYGNVFNRSKSIYDTNRSNAADTYATNYGVSRDKFDRDYIGARDEYQPKQLEATLNFGRQWDEYLAKLGVAKDIFATGID